MLPDLSNIWRWLRLLEYPNLTGLLPTFASLSLCPPHHNQISPWGSLACAQNKSDWCVPYSVCFFLSLLPTNGGVWYAWSPLLPRWSPPRTKHSVPCCSLSQLFSDGSWLEVPWCHICLGVWAKGVKVLLPNLALHILSCALKQLHLRQYLPGYWTSHSSYHNVPLSSHCIPSL